MRKQKKQQPSVQEAIWKRDANLLVRAAKMLTPQQFSEQLSDEIAFEEIKLICKGSDFKLFNIIDKLHKKYFRYIEIFPHRINGITNFGVIISSSADKIRLYTEYNFSSLRNAKDLIDFMLKCLHSSEFSLLTGFHGGRPFENGIESAFCKLYELVRIINNQELSHFRKKPKHLETLKDILANTDRYYRSLKYGT